jgi:tRNA (adenine37-N6)-methyltransferase
MLFRRRKRAGPPRDPFAGPVTLTPIGHVRNAVTQPRPRGWERVVSTIVLSAEHHARVEGMGAFSHVIVVCYLDLAAEAPENPERLTLASGATYGILATRSQLRPNHLGVSAVELVGVEVGALRVRGLDAIDGTAVLDVKPYLPDYDAHPHARIPDFGRRTDRPGDA